MSAKLYEALLNELALLAGVDAVELVASQTLVVDNVAMSLQLQTNENAVDELLTFCDFGTVDERDPTSILERLLDVNLFLARSSTPTAFARNPESGHILLCQRWPLFETDAAELLDTLRTCAAQAEAWRTSRFLEPEQDDEPATQTAARNIKSTVTL